MNKVTIASSIIMILSVKLHIYGTGDKRTDDTSHYGSFHFFLNSIVIKIQLHNFERYKNQTIAR